MKKYQIFLSSTYRDLVKERQDAIKSIVDLGHMPVGMEGFPAIDMEQFEYIKRVIDQCDYYILIVGNRYGSLAPDGISFTEKEYRYAVESGQKVLAFVKDLPESDPILLDKKFCAFREHVRHRRMVREWHDGDDLKYPVSQSLNVAFVELPRAGWVRANEARKAPGKRRSMFFWIALVMFFAMLITVIQIAIIGTSAYPPQTQKSERPVRQPLTAAQPLIQSTRAAPIDPSERATKIGIWQSVQYTHRNALLNALSGISEAQQNWEKIDSGNRRYFLDRFSKQKEALLQSSSALEALRAEFPKYDDVQQALKQTKTEDVIIAFDAFIKDYGTDADQPPTDYNRTMRPRAGELSRQIDRLRDWLNDLGKFVAMRQSELR